MAAKRPDTQQPIEQVATHQVRLTGSSGQPAANDAVKFRAFPDDSQYDLIARTIGSSRFYWNLILDLAIITKEQIDRSLVISPKEAKSFPEFAFLKEIDTIALDNVKCDYHQAWKNHRDNPQHFGRPT